jgi:hypothetical protein
VIGVGLAQFPEAAADHVNQRGGHIYRADTTLRRVAIQRSNLTRKRSGERLHPIAAGKAASRLGSVAAVREPLGQDLLHPLPRDRLERVIATLVAGIAQQRPRARHAGERCLMTPDELIAQPMPLLICCSGFPSM